MSVVKHIDDIVSWAQLSICSKIEFKKPDEDESGAKYEPIFVNPQTFAIYTPTKDRLPPDLTYNSPSLCVQLQDGDEDLTKNKGRLKINFALSTWNPGLHKKGELFIPEKDVEGKISYTKWDDPAGKSFQRHSEGWRDVWNFVDLCTEVLKKTSSIGNLRIAKEDGISFGSYTEDGNYLDFYPYFLAWVSFTVEYKINNAIFEPYL